MAITTSSFSPQIRMGQLAEYGTARQQGMTRSSERPLAWLITIFLISLPSVNPVRGYGQIEKRDRSA